MTQLTVLQYSFFRFCSQLCDAIIADRTSRGCAAALSNMPSARQQQPGGAPHHSLCLTPTRASGTENTIITRSHSILFATWRVMTSPPLGMRIVLPEPETAVAAAEATPDV